MAIKIHIPTPLRSFVDGKDEVVVESASVSNMGDLLQQLVGDYSGLKKHLYNERNELRSFINIYLNDEDIRYQGNLSCKVKDGDTVALIPSIAGGSASGTAFASSKKRKEQAKPMPSQERKEGRKKGFPMKNEEDALSVDELRRYDRHIILPEVGLEGQTRLKNSSALLIGAGGLGSPLALYLAAAGCGTNWHC